MKFILATMIILSAPVFAQVDLFVDGEQVVIPSTHKLVVVPKHWPTDRITRVSFGNAKDIPTAEQSSEGCDPEDLVVSPGCAK
jgi:hypothetical protein